MKLISYILLTAMLLLNIACSSSNNLEYPDYTPPTIDYQPRLIYPTLAQENLWQGKSIVLLKISNTGKVTSTRIGKTSGYKMLDDAAKDFCSNIVFNPAVKNSEPIKTQLRMGIDFSFDDNDYDPQSYIRDVNELYRAISVASEPSIYEYQKQVLSKHTEFVFNTKDAMHFNNYISDVVEDDITNDWRPVWNSWPLSFLVYHDFLNRYETFSDSAKVKKQMYTALKEDVKYIKKSPNNIEEKEMILGKIIVFMQKNYPEIEIDTINFNLDKKETPNI